MPPQAFTALVKRLAASLGGDAKSAALRQRLAQVAQSRVPEDVIEVITHLGRLLAETGRVEDAALLHAGIRETFPRAQVPDWPGITPAAPPPPPPAPVAPPAAAVPAAPARGPVFIASDPFSLAAADVDNAMLRIRLHEARMAFPAALGLARTPQHFARVFRMVGPIFENWARTEGWLAVRAAMAEHASGFAPDSLRVAEATELRICLALRDHAGFARRYGHFAARGPLAREDLVLGAIAQKIYDRAFPDFTAEKVICIGLPKSGTTSFGEALRILGYSSLHLNNPATNDLFGDDDLFLFDSFADVPLLEHFENYYFMLPKARFVYTVRPYASWKKSFLVEVNARGEDAYPALKARITRGEGALWGNRLAWQAWSVLGNAASLEEAYNRYDQRVRRFFADKPADRFLEFNLAAGHGWPELCKLTGRPIPSVPYPHRNPQTRAQPAPAKAKAS
jgi:hypothetical protein